MAKEMVKIINRGIRTYVTSAGELKPGKSVEVGAKEAEALLGYRDLADAESAFPSANKGKGKGAKGKAKAKSGGKEEGDEQEKGEEGSSKED